MQDWTTNFDTATARLGYVFYPNLLAYVKGGAAWIRNKDVLFGPGFTFVSESASWTASGYDVGGGFEYQVAPNWSVFAEYNYMDFGTRTIAFIATPGFVPPGEHINVSQRVVQDFLFGVNYRFSLGGLFATR